jgi:hypothetical protein
MSQERLPSWKSPLQYKVLLHLLKKELLKVKDAGKLLFEQFKTIKDRDEQEEFKDLLANDVSRIGLDQATYLELLDAMQIEVFKSAFNKERQLPSIEVLREGIRKSLNRRFGKTALTQIKLMDQLLGTNNDTDEE